MALLMAAVMLETASLTMADAAAWSSTDEVGETVAVVESSSGISYVMFW